jgi:ribosomal protein S2
MQLNREHQLLVYADYVIILGNNIHTIKKNTKALLGASKKVGLKVNAKKTEYMFVTHHQNAQQNHKLLNANKSSENVVKFRYVGMTLTNQNCIHEEINNRLNSRNDYYHSVHNIFVFLSPH